MTDNVREISIAFCAISVVLSHFHIIFMIIYVMRNNNTGKQISNSTVFALLLDMDFWIHICILNVF